MLREKWGRLTVKSLFLSVFLLFVMGGSVFAQSASGDKGGFSLIYVFAGAIIVLFIIIVLSIARLPKQNQ